jgi:hypothetical protein
MTEKSIFEMSVRVLGNELFGIKLQTEDFSTKLLVFSLIAFIGFGGGIAAFGPDIIDLFGGAQ